MNLLDTLFGLQRQRVLSWLLLRVQFRRRLGALAPVAVPA